MNRFLIIKTSSLGDIVQTFPAVAYLRARFPTAQIDWIAEEPFIPLLKTHPAISNTIPIHTKSWRKQPFSAPTRHTFSSLYRHLRCTPYDAVFDLQGNCKSAALLLLAKSKNKVGFGRRTVPELPNLLASRQRFDPPSGKNRREDYLYVVQSFFQDNTVYIPEGVQLYTTPEEQSQVRNILLHPCLQHRKRVLVCPGAQWINKRLPEKTLIKYLTTMQNSEATAFLFLWGTSEEKQMAELLQAQFSDNSVVVDKLSLPALQNLMAQVHCVVAMDSLPLHLCGTTNTPAIAFFGPTNAFKYMPLGAHHKAIQGECPYGIRFEARCPKLRTCSTGACLRSEAFLGRLP